MHTCSKLEFSMHFLDGWNAVFMKSVAVIGRYPEYIASTTSAAIEGSRDRQEVL